MVSTLRQGVAVLRSDGVATLVRDGTAYLRREASRTYSRVRYDPDSPPLRVADADWDDLLLLDACRYDQFERLHDLDGRLESRISPGSCTPEFLEASVEGTTMHDTVYVTGNPMYRKCGVAEAFHDVIDVWQSDWDEENSTVHPAEMVDATVEAHERYPHKRLLVHFVQPHYPFIGKAGEALAADADEGLSGIEMIQMQIAGTHENRENATPWELLDAGTLDEDAVQAAYDQNLEIVLEYVEELLETLPGRTVVTSDHGNLVGGRVAPFGAPTYGHPPETHVDELRKVPWFVVEGEGRRRIVAEPTREAEAADQDDSGIVADRLADLGYADV